METEALGLGRERVSKADPHREQWPPRPVPTGCAHRRKAEASGPRALAPTPTLHPRPRRRPSPELFPHRPLPGRSDRRTTRPSPPTEVTAHGAPRPRLPRGRRHRHRPRPARRVCAPRGLRGRPRTSGPGGEARRARAPLAGPAVTQRRPAPRRAGPETRATWSGNKGPRRRPLRRDRRPRGARRRPARYLAHV